MSTKTIVDLDTPTAVLSSVNEGAHTRSIWRLEGEAVLVCAGELDKATAPALRDEVRSLLPFRPARVVIDLSSVSSFDAAAIGEFVRARNACRAAGGDLVVRTPSSSGRRMLSDLGLTDLIADGPEHIAEPLDASLDVGAHWDELVAAWRTACATPRYGAAPLGFDPTAVMAVLATSIDSPRSIDRSAFEAALAGIRCAEVSSATAVRQLWALHDVLHSQIETHRGATCRSEHEEGRRAALEEALAGLASAAVTELEQATLLDPLTGLLNRRALDRDLRQSLAAARRHNQFLSLVMIDIEGLKSTNDLFGHAAGDDTLKGVASSLASALRAGDNAYRIGGDEFVLLLPELRPEDVDGVMERTSEGCQGAFTWGCACVKCDGTNPSAEEPGHMLELADQRMLDHRALTRGSRDRSDVVLAPIPAPAEPTAELAGRFSAASRSSVVIEEAKGLIAGHFDIEIGEAFVMLRAFSSEQHLPVRTVAVALVDRTIAVDLLAQHGHGAAAGAGVDSGPGARGIVSSKGS